MCTVDIEEETDCPVVDSCFLIGQDEGGRWVALEARGISGGIFVDRESALRYALSETGRQQKAIQFSEQKLSLWSGHASGALAAGAPSAPPAQSLTNFAFSPGNPPRTANWRPNRSFIRWWPVLRRGVRLALVPLSLHGSASVRGLHGGKAA